MCYRKIFSQNQIFSGVFTNSCSQKNICIYTSEQLIWRVNQSKLTVVANFNEYCTFQGMSSICNNSEHLWTFKTKETSLQKANKNIHALMYALINMLLCVGSCFSSKPHKICPYIACLSYSRYLLTFLIINSNKLAVE